MNKATLITNALITAGLIDAKNLCKTEEIVNFILLNPSTNITQSNKLIFEVVVLYDKGFGPECLNAPKIEASTVEEAQLKAEKAATVFFLEKFGKKTQWNEVKIRPVK
jgi:hypothetical protein